MAQTQWQHCSPFSVRAMVTFIKLKYVWLQGDKLVRALSWKGHMFDPCSSRLIGLQCPLARQQPEWNLPLCLCQTVSSVAVSHLMLTLSTIWSCKHHADVKMQSCKAKRARICCVTEREKLQHEVGQTVHANIFWHLFKSDETTERFGGKEKNKSKRNVKYF